MFEKPPSPRRQLKAEEVHSAGLQQGDNVSLVLTAEAEQLQHHESALGCDPHAIAHRGGANDSLGDIDGARLWPGVTIDSEPRRGREDVRKFMMDFHAAFPDLKFWGAADLIAEGDFVVGRWEGGGTHTGRAFSDFLVGSQPAASGRKVHFTGTTVLRVENGKIAEEVGLDDGVAALTQLGILKAA